MKRKGLEVWGRKRAADYVRLVREPDKYGVSVLRVLWHEAARGRTESFEDTRRGLAEAKAFAQGTHERLAAPAASLAIAPITLRAVWDAYVTAKVDSWREATLRNKRARWNKFELFVGKDAFAHLVTRETLDKFKRALVANKHAPNQVRLHVEVVLTVWRWAIDRDLVPPSKVTTYEVELSRDEKRAATKMTEFRDEERDKILAALDPRDRVQWRTWALTTLFGYCGPRQRAARSLEWRDVDLEARTIRWRGELDKVGTERLQPMPGPVVEAFMVCYGWRCFEGYTGRYVFFGVQRRTRAQALRRDTRREKAKESLEGITAHEKPYTYAAYIGQLHAACDRAGVKHVAYRGAHGFRRGVAGDVRRLTGSDKKAAEWIGDKSTRVVQDHYLLERVDEQREIAVKIGGPKP